VGKDELNETGREKEFNSNSASESAGNGSKIMKSFFSISWMK